MQGVGDYLNNTLEERRFLMYRDAEFRGTLFISRTEQQGMYIAGRWSARYSGLSIIRASCQTHSVRVGATTRQWGDDVVMFRCYGYSNVRRWSLQVDFLKQRIQVLMTSSQLRLSGESNVTKTWKYRTIRRLLLTKTIDYEHPMHCGFSICIIVYSLYRIEELSRTRRNVYIILTGKEETLFLRGRTWNI